MAGSNFITPLGLAIAYWSELGVEEMCKIHMKKRVPLVAAFGSWNQRTLPLSQAIGPLTMILAPGRYSAMEKVLAMEKVQELRDLSGQVGCYDPPIRGPAEKILRTILRYPASGTLLEYLKIWYYQITEQYSRVEALERGWRDKVNHIIGLFYIFPFGSLKFVVRGVDEIYDSFRWTLRMGDSKAVEILLEEYSHRNVSPDIKYLIRHSQNRLHRRSDREQQDPLRRIFEIAVPEEHTNIAHLLMEKQNQIFSQVKLQRTNEGMRFLWRPLYRLYLNLEQTEYMRFNDWYLHRKPYKTPLVTEFRSWFPSLRIPTYPLFFAILWVILGRMLYDLSRFIRNTVEPFPSSNCVWVVFLVIIVSIA